MQQPIDRQLFCDCWNEKRQLTIIFVSKLQFVFCVYVNFFSTQNQIIEETLALLRYS